jgi:hypothetical protein
MHAVRGVIGTLGNICFFWTLTHMLLADAMALQFSRPLFMIPIALVFLGEIAGLRRIAITLVGFAGIALYARPFTEGFDPGAFIGAAGALFGALVVVCIKRLSTTEPTRTIMFYYAISNALFSLIPTLWLWVTPNWVELAMLPHRLLSGARLFHIRGTAGAMEPRRHGGHCGEFAVPRAHRAPPLRQPAFSRRRRGRARPAPCREPHSIRQSP